MKSIQLIGLPGIPMIQTGDDLAAVIKTALEENDLSFEDGDVLAVTSKIVSKAEGRWVNLEDVTPDDEALRVAEECEKDPREVAVILSESKQISRIRQNLLITEHRLGMICANAGMDHSNARPDGDWRLILPEDPDQSAVNLRDRLNADLNTTIAVIITDSHGRPFRMGTVGVAIGSAGLPALWDLRGTPDLFGDQLQYTEVGFADELAAAAGLVQGQAAEGMPVVIIRGMSYPTDDSSRAADLIRPEEMDLYR